MDYCQKESILDNPKKYNNIHAFNQLSMTAVPLLGRQDKYPIEIDTFDTNLSGVKCAKLYHEEDGIDCTALIEECMDNQVDQLTIFIRHTRENVLQLFESGFHYLTSKVSYVKNEGAMAERVRPTAGVLYKPFEEGSIERLVELAHIVGKKSRYYLDSDNPEMWRKAYRQWAINAVDGYVTDVQMAVNQLTGFPVGFIFMKDKGQTSSVNLIALDNAYRRRHIGGNLLIRGEESAKKRGITGFEVTTEAENVPAQSLYQRHGYRINEHHLVYQKKF